MADLSHIDKGTLNSLVMTTNSIQQELLLITGTTFSSRQCCGKDEAENSGHLSENDQLQEACWNGLLKEMLPELFEQAASSKSFYLWQIREAESFLEIELGEFPTERDKHFSINPYAFLDTQSYN